jgi:hypothetical protein
LERVEDAIDFNNVAKCTDRLKEGLCGARIIQMSFDVIRWLIYFSPGSLRRRIEAVLA